MNEIAQVKVVRVDTPNGPKTVMMMAINIGDPAAAEAFVSYVAEQFKLHRTLAPPDTSILLVTVVGGLTAQRFAAQWLEIEKCDGIVRAYMSLMSMADVIQATKSGQQLSSASLLRTDA
jgi:hypothetical protein